jgi:diaminopimelate decarboxylase
LAGGNLKISTGHADSKSKAAEISKKHYSDKGNRPVYPHLHTHTGVREKMEVFAKGLKCCLKCCISGAIIDLGGGFKVPYKPGDEGTDIELGKKVKEEFEWFGKYNRHLQS